MAEIVNLRMARKRKARAERAKEADANRARFGRTGADRRQAEAERQGEARRLDGHLRVRPAAPSRGDGDD